MGARRERSREGASAAVVTLSLWLTFWPALAVAGGQEDVESLRASITSVVTGGYWEGGNQRGVVRLVVATRGFDHRGSRLYAQWVQDGDDASAPAVVRTMLVEDVSADFWVLGPPRVELVQKRWRAVIESTSTRAGERRRGRWLIWFGKPGEVQVQRSG